MDLQRFICVFLVLFTNNMLHLSDAYSFKVGGKDGRWGLNPSESYDHWSKRLRFLVNDTISFIYQKWSDSVLVVSKDDYDKCNTENPIMKMDDGNSVFVFDRSGPFYFISGNKANCDQGQKVAIVVITMKKPKLPPAAPPASPTAAPPPAMTTIPSSPEISPVSGSNSPMASPMPSTTPPSPSGQSPTMSPESQVPMSSLPPVASSPSAEGPMVSSAPGTNPGSPSPMPASGPGSSGTHSSSPSPLASGNTPANINSSSPRASAPASSPSVVLVSFSIVLGVVCGSFINSH